MILSATISAITAVSLVLSYQIVNNEAQTVYIADNVPKIASDGGHIFSATNAYVMLAENKRLILSKEVIAIPPGIKAERPAMPYFRALQPGETVIGHIEVQLPARAEHPYISFNYADRPIDIAEISIRIGYLRSANFQSREVVVYPKRINDSPFFAADYGNVLKHQRILDYSLRLNSPIKAFAISRIR